MVLYKVFASARTTPLSPPETIFSPKACLRVNNFIFLPSVSLGCAYLNLIPNTFKPEAQILVMYKFTTRSRKAEKQFYEALKSRSDVSEKLERLKLDPRHALDAHKLKGKLDGKWACSLGYDLRLVYEIDDVGKEIIVVAAGSHKIYG